MLKAAVILGNASVLPEENCDVIGADRGALTAADAGLRMKYAIGDFDSVTEEELARIEKNADTVIRLNPVKDDTDSEAAVNLAIAEGYERIILYSDMAGRADHTLINMRLLMKYPGILELRDRQNLLYALGEGEYVLEKKEWKYLSVFAFDAVISLAGVRYPLEQRHITQEDLYTVSNEILKENASLCVYEGRVLVMQCSDR